MASEKIVFNEMTTGASGDLKHATRLARRLVTHYGMSDEIGPISFTNEEINGYAPWEEIYSQNNHYSDKTLDAIDKEVARMLKLAYNKAEETIKKNKEKLDIVAEKLLKQETIEKTEFEKMMKDEIKN